MNPSSTIPITGRRGKSRQSAGAWHCRRPFRTPVWTIYVVASLCELFAAISGKPSPLTRDFIAIGRVSHWGDTKRARQELIPELKYRTLENGLSTL